MKTVLVTGGAGFIGGCLVRQFVSGKDTRVVNLDKLTYAGNLDSIDSIFDDPMHTFVHGDIADRELVSRLLHEYNPVAVINLAAESHVDRSIDSPALFVETNVVGTFQLLEACREHWIGLTEPDKSDFRFVHISTDEVYGSLGPTGSFRESSSYAPNSPYSASKASSDHFVRAYFHTYGLPTVITNCSNNYGPFQFPEKLIPLMILNAMQGKPLPVYGDGSNVRDWLHVEDHCEAIRTVVSKGAPGEVYNIGGNCERTNLQIVRAICDVVDRLCPDLPHTPCEGLISFVEDRPGHDVRYAIDARKIEAELGWCPSRNFESGLETTVQWYRDNDQWVDRVMSGNYRGERLGLSQTNH